MVDAPPPVNAKDLETLASQWLVECGSPKWCDYADVDMDGVVNMRDLAYLAETWSGSESF
jgi:hypothetical protein